MVCYRDLAINFYKKKVNNKFDGHYEPQNNRLSFESADPLYDIRHNNNFTKTKKSPTDFKNKKYAEGWQEKIIKI